VQLLWSLLRWWGSHWYSQTKPLLLNLWVFLYFMWSCVLKGLDCEGIVEWREQTKRMELLVIKWDCCLTGILLYNLIAGEFIVILWEMLNQERRGESGFNVRVKTLLWLVGVSTFVIYNWNLRSLWYFIFIISIPVVQKKDNWVLRGSRLWLIICLFLVLKAF
jgi:hypothetical protein